MEPDLTGRSVHHGAKQREEGLYEELEDGGDGGELDVGAREVGGWQPLLC